ncbi:hypothetical protein SEA_FUZZBUSTER_18 [Microbacterium phage FuzzBuster]|uniref:Uncharacterized protein n=1 Tax=Microbacterium phage FuzzBuster TaxID=2590935 RepID=A0A516KUZ8_9CAUD|nr:hypothetical protein SEA_FUZZBUSTER_18 [Microbacterium phage FuzzBuster]
MMAAHADNAALSFLPTPPEGHFWEVRYEEKAPRSKPLKLSLRESFRAGTPIGETIGWEYSEANEKSLTDTANVIMVRSADRKLFIGTLGVTTGAKR